MSGEVLKIDGVYQQIFPDFDTVKSRRWQLKKIQGEEVYLECLNKDKLNAKWLNKSIFQNFYKLLT